VLGDTISLAPTIDPLYYFSHWEADSNSILPNTSTEQVTFYANYPDTIRLHTILKPTILSFISEGDTICTNENDLAEVLVDFSGIAPFTFVYEIDGVAQPSITTTDDPYIIYTRKAGEYTLLSYADATGIGVTSGSAYVVETTPPIAHFRISPDDRLSILHPQAHFIADTFATVNWLWNFGDNSSDSLIHNPYHLYADSVGLYQITLIVTDVNNCKDTTFNQLWVKDEYWLYIPNSFTPDLDGINDKFCISYHAIREETFTFNVYNRIGKLIFSTNNINELNCDKGWDGKHRESGKELPMGTYVYEIYFKDFEGWKYQDSGFINIIR
jgi:gliding motility-associated-like protein